MIKSVSQYQVSEIFTNEQKLVYTIPRYQREYTWSTSQWEELFDDLNENEPGYFLGSIICIDLSADAIRTRTLEVVDGQQRLTTLSLLFAALYPQLQKLGANDESVQDELSTLRKKLILKDNKAVMRLTLQKQNNNLEDYAWVINKIGLLNTADKVQNSGNRKIVRAYRYFEKRIDTLIEGDNKKELLFDFLNKVYEACLVKIEVGNHSDAYTLFETLNNRGAPLTAVDLIKNKLLSQLEKSDAGNIEHHFEEWNQLITQLGDDYSIQERFFRQYFNAFKNELATPFKSEDSKSDQLASIATKSNLIPIYEKLINEDPKEFLKKLHAASDCYSQILLIEPNTNNPRLEEAFKNIDHVQAAPAYVLLMHLILLKDKYELSDIHILKIATLLVSFFVRRNVTDTPPTRAITRLFMKIIDQLHSLKSDEVYSSVLNQLKSESTSDDIFREKLAGPIYEENPGIARFILCYLAEKAMTLENNVDLWIQDGKQYRWTIEHIFPQGQNIPQSWIDMIANGDQVQASDYQKEYVHKLGNLTITAYNSSLGNKSFIEKRDRTNKDNRPIGFKNKLILNAELENAEAWTIPQIEERTGRLVNQVMSEFDINGLKTSP